MNTFSLRLDIYLGVKDRWRLRKEENYGKSPIALTMLKHHIEVDNFSILKQFIWDIPVYSTRFTFCYLYLFKWTQPIISTTNVSTFLPCNMGTLLIFSSTPLAVFIVLHHNGAQACLHACNKLLALAVHSQFHSIHIFIYANLPAHLEFNLKNKEMEGTKFLRNNVSEIVSLQLKQRYVYSQGHLLTC